MFILVQKIIFYSQDKADNRHHDDDDTNPPVDEPDAADIEPRTYLVNEIGDKKPPPHGSRNNRQITYYMVPQLRLGQKEIKAGEKTYIKEQDKRIGKSEQEGGNEVLRVGVD